MSNDQSAEDAARAFPFDAREAPTTFEPVQLDLNKAPLKCLDWWNTRSNLFCCLNPFLRCFSGHQVIDSTDPKVWEEQVANPSNKRCPDSMKGVWWLKYNTAAEKLVTVFGDANFSGTFNEEGTDGMGTWERPLKGNWSRDNAIFGLALSVWGKRETSIAKGYMDLKRGICTVSGKRGEGIQIVYRKSDDEWWKVHYAANPGEPGDQDIEYMYKWLKVIDKDGNTTKYWDEYVEWADAPLPHSNCGTSWWPFWGCCLSDRQVMDIMVMPNPKQAVNFVADRENAKKDK